MTPDEAGAAGLIMWEKNERRPSPDRSSPHRPCLVDCVLPARTNLSATGLPYLAPSNRFERRDAALRIGDSGIRPARQHTELRCHLGVVGIVLEPGAWFRWPSRFRIGVGARSSDF